MVHDYGISTSSLDPLETLLNPQNERMSAVNRDYFSREYIWTNHWFSGDMLGFQGSIKPLIQIYKKSNKFGR